MDVLTTSGSFAIVAPNLDVSFTAPVGDNRSQLASIAATEMSVPGYTAVAVGTEVYFSSVYTGQIDFTPSGDGIDFGMATVPEPSSLTLMLLGVLPLIFVTHGGLVKRIGIL